ncbi:tigger transposable element-derived protein 6-like isoform X1 [Neodiprion virginianus]|uniref:tigger transposable element-derived protein 6-like isoform X1 n=2 Tax=Neodiprion virginianus TaxID=2961670 RepID=UPI001EE76CFA|nr:tigger transposable element-derived protein 6-like isoform X1 [Neodiprion virginianus]
MTSLRKTPRSINDKAKVEILREKLFQWTCEQHATNQPLNKEIIGRKAVDLSLELGLGDVKFSKRWVTIFLKKYGFPPSFASTLHGPVFKDYREWIDLMRPHMSQYRYKDVFQVDEMGMYHDISPEKIPGEAVGCVTCRNGEDREHRVTLLLCCSASGLEKLPPLICGKFDTPVQAHYSCRYSFNPDAWITREVFRVWITELNARMARSNRKIVLLLSRSRVHAFKDNALSNVGLIFFPKEFPPNLQPLRANIFHRFKTIYRQSYTAKKVTMGSNFNWTFADTIDNIVKAWESVPKEFILSSFRRANIRRDNDTSPIISCPEWNRLHPGISFRSYVTFDDNLSVSFSSIRRSHRLAEISTTCKHGAQTRFASGRHPNGAFHEPIEIGSDSESSDEDAVQETSMDKSDSNLPLHIACVEHVNDGFDARNTRTASTFRGENSPRVSDINADMLLPCVVADIVRNMVGKVEDIAEDRGIDEDDTGLRAQDEESERRVMATRKRVRGEIDGEEETNDDSREPTEKRWMGEEAWYKIYEHSFVFGAPDGPRGTASDRRADVKAGALPQTGINSSQKTEDLEKRSIFTLSNTPSIRPRN